MKKRQGLVILYSLRGLLSAILAIGPIPIWANNSAPPITSFSVAYPVNESAKKSLADLDLSIPEKYLRSEDLQTPEFTKVTLNFEICKKIPQMDLDPLYDAYHEFKEELRTQCKTFLTQPEMFNQQYTIYLPFNIQNKEGRIELPSMTPEQLEELKQHPLYKKFEKALDGKFNNVEAEMKMRNTFLIVLCVALMGFLTVLPKDVTNWNRTADKSTLEWWEYSVTRPPVWDKDRPFFNLVGHPLAGSWYYLLARDAGLTPFQSFMYSVFVSTVIWEYGVEAPAERPSIQDLILTPVAGSAVGWIAEKMMAVIKSKDRKVLGSRALGEVVLFFIDPLTAIITNSHTFLKKTFPDVHPRFEVFYGPMSLNPYDDTFKNDGRNNPGRAWMFRVRIPFHF